MNKKGYIRILEAIFAILIIFGVVVFTTQQTREKEFGVPGVIESAQSFVLDTISFDTALRFCVIEGINDSSGERYVGTCNSPDFVMDVADLGSAPTGRVIIDRNTGLVRCGESLERLINTSLPPAHFYTCEICDSPLSCLGSGGSRSIPSDGRNVYTKTFFLAISDEVNEKVIRLYYWGCSEKDDKCIFS